MKICAVAELHGHLPEIPSCDLLLIARGLSPITLTGRPSVSATKGIRAFDIDVAIANAALLCPTYELVEGRRPLLFELEPGGSAPEAR